MAYNLYLDDERNPKTDKAWIVVRSYDEAVEYVITNGLPSYVSFDHDLGAQKNGYEFAKWLANEVLYQQEDMFEWNVHSANPVGSDNINKHLTFVSNYIEQLG